MSNQEKKVSDLLWKLLALQESRIMGHSAPGDIEKSIDLLFDVVIEQQKMIAEIMKKEA